jgi:NTP pyrophosphatase (non-canonical NTP hydrolase)
MKTGFEDVLELEKVKKVKDLQDLDAELGDFYNNYLSSTKLLALTGAVSLLAIKYLEIQVDSRKTGLGDLGKFWLI